MLANPMLSDRIAIFTESVIREMTRLALEHDAINLAQGFPDFPAPEAIKEAAIEAIRADYNQYAITLGARPLREAIALYGDNPIFTSLLGYVYAKSGNAREARNIF